VVNVFYSVVGNIVVSVKKISHTLS
jgi:hypothetical protein